MSIYNKDSYSQSKCIFLAGPIEWWWQENRFDTPEAVRYREYREALSKALVDAGFLVYRPWDAFKGDWNERMQDVNDFVLMKCDVVIDMTPPGVVALGTESEVSLAKARGIPVVYVEETKPKNRKKHLKFVVKAINEYIFLDKHITSVLN